MKLIRLTDDRYVIDAGSGIRPDHLAALKQYWEEWWEQHPGEIPTAFVIGGHEQLLVYEDRRDADIERRVAELEQHVHVVARREHEPIHSGPPEEPA